MGQLAVGGCTVLEELVRVVGATVFRGAFRLYMQ